MLYKKWNALPRLVRLVLMLIGIAAFVIIAMLWPKLEKLLSTVASASLIVASCAVLVFVAWAAVAVIVLCRRRK